jgi:hypothetical protein
MRFVATLLALVLASFVLASVAMADVPGVHEESRLEPIASFVAGKPVKVFCGNDAQGWADAVTSVFHAPITNVGGFSFIEQGEAYVNPVRCNTVLDFKTAKLSDLAVALLTVVHESVHVGTGSRDEWATDCTAVSDMWGAGWMLGIRQPQLARLHALTLAEHLRKSPDYVRGGNC